MRGKRLIGVGALALTLTAGIGGPATAEHDGSSGVRTSGQLAKVGDRLSAVCPGVQKVVVYSHSSTPPPGAEIGWSITSNGGGYVAEVTRWPEGAAPYTAELEYSCVDPYVATPGDSTTTVEEWVTVDGVGKTGSRACCPAGMKPLGNKVVGWWPNYPGEGGSGPAFATAPVPGTKSVSVTAVAGHVTDERKNVLVRVDCR